MSAAHWPKQTATAAALQAPIPKQYLEILGQPIALYSLRTFAAMPEVGEIIVVCEPEYRRARCLILTQNLDLSARFVDHASNAACFWIQTITITSPGRQLFTDAHVGTAPLRFATPGTERQDSVFSGFQVRHRRDAAVRLEGTRSRWHAQLCCH